MKVCLNVHDAMWYAVKRMGKTAGLAPHTFLAELLETAIINAYETRFGEKIGEMDLHVEPIEPDSPHLVV